MLIRVVLHIVHITTIEPPLNSSFQTLQIGSQGSGGMLHAP